LIGALPALLSCPPRPSPPNTDPPPHPPPPDTPSPTDNFLFLSNADDSPLKATDFGLSIRHAADEAKLTSRSGTPAYM